MTLGLVCWIVVASSVSAAPQYFAFPQSPADELHNAITSLTYGLHYRLAQAAQAAAAQTLLGLGPPPPTYLHSVPFVDDYDIRVRPGAVVVTSGSGDRNGFAAAGISNRPNGISASAAAVSTSG